MEPRLGLVLDRTYALSLRNLWFVGFVRPDGRPARQPLHTPEAPGARGSGTSGIRGRALVKGRVQQAIPAEVRSGSGSFGEPGCALMHGAGPVVGGGGVLGILRPFRARRGRCDGCCLGARVRLAQSYALRDGGGAQHRTTCTLTDSAPHLHAIFPQGRVRLASSMRLRVGLVWIGAFAGGRSAEEALRPLRPSGRAPTARAQAGVPARAANARGRLAHAGGSGCGRSVTLAVMLMSSARDGQEEESGQESREESREGLCR